MARMSRKKNAQKKERRAFRDHHGHLKKSSQFRFRVLTGSSWVAEFGGEKNAMSFGTKTWERVVLSGPMFRAAN